MNSAKITIQATVNADLQKVWTFFTEPDHITGWNFAVDSWCCQKASNDLKVGGRYSARMEAKDGSFGFDFEATYDQVLACEKIAYTLDDGRTVVTAFEKLGKGTKITTTFEAENQNPIDMQRDGWQAILNHFKKYVESN